MCWIWEVGCKGDQYAAWTQAIGSILALVIAIAVAYYQNNKELQRREKEATEKHLQQLESIFFLTNAMYLLLVEYQYSLSINTVAYEKIGTAEAAGDLLVELRSQSSDELNDEQRNAYFVLRRRFSAIVAHIHFGDEIAFIVVHIQEIHDLKTLFHSYLDLGRLKL